MRCICRTSLSGECPEANVMDVKQGTLREERPMENVRSDCMVVRHERVGTRCDARCMMINKC